MRLVSTIAGLCLSCASWAAAGCGDDASVGSGTKDASTPDFGGAERLELVQAYLYSELVDEDAGTSEPNVEDGDLAFAIRGGRGYVRYVGPFGCGDPYEARLVREGHDVYVLLRFTGPGHNACGAAHYAMRFVIDPADTTTRVTVYRQDDEDGPIDIAGHASPGPSDADCEGMTECGVDERCALEGASAEVLGPVDGPADTHTCATLDACGKSVCAWQREACMMTCGEPDCAILESFPVQISCDN